MEQEADSAEDEERDIPESQQETYLERDKKTKWSRIKPPTNVRTRRHNIVTHLPGPKGDAKQVRSESECLRLFLDDNILLESLVKYTHIYIELQVKVKEMHVSLIAQKSNP